MEQDKILIVEDDPDTRFILERTLIKNKYEVRVAENGSHALEVLDEYKPKVIIADWTMPVLDGLQLCNKLKLDERYKSIYFIVLTARSSLGDRIMGLDFGADEFLVKPVENSELLARIRSGVRMYNLQTELRTQERNKAVIELACGIGHQINNPLSSLSATISNIQTELTPEQQSTFNDDFRILAEAISRIQQSVNALINLKSAESVEYSSEVKMVKLDGKE